MNIMLNNLDCEGFLKVYIVAKLVVGHKDFLKFLRQTWLDLSCCIHTYSEHATRISNLTRVMVLLHCIKL